MEKIEGDILKGNTLTLILSLIEGQAMYGLEISKEINRRSGGALYFREGLVYPALHYLEKGGLIEGKWRHFEQGPRRKYYQLTPRGKREAKLLREKWSTFSAAVNQVLKDQDSHGN
jgi:PadR family transcriptional regulator, regulatory protein PadR